MQFSVMQMLVWLYQFRPLKLHVVLEVRKLLYLNNTAVVRHVLCMQLSTTNDLHMKENSTPTHIFCALLIMINVVTVQI